MRALLSEYRFGGVETVSEFLPLPDTSIDRVRELARIGARLLDLDAEDFDALTPGSGPLPDPVVRQVRAAQFPRTPTGGERGSLDSLVPLYRLMLEALAIRWQRNEPVHVVILFHLIAEYFPLLAWESTLGHAGDPVRLAALADVPESRWGQTCDHTASERAAAQRVSKMASADSTGWTIYLDRYHSRVSDALGKCAIHPGSGRPHLDGVCRTPCGLWTSLAPGVQDGLGARVQLARMYAESAVVELRHHAPVGHFFGVPAPSEIRDAWDRTWERLARPWDSASGGSGNPLPVLADAPDILTGMTLLVSAVAGVDVAPSTALAGIRDAIAEICADGSDTLQGGEAR